MSYTSADTPVDLVINRLSRKIYDELSATPGMLDENQLYLIEDEDFDVLNKRVVNVKTPLSANDAVPLGYLREQYVRQGDILTYVDNSKVYGERKSGGWQDGETYIDGRLGVYKKDCKSSAPNWKCAVVSGSVPASSVTVGWRSGFGWHFKVNGSMPDGAHYQSDELVDTLQDTFTYSGESTTVSATCWHKVDTLVPSKAVYGALSSVTASSSAADVAAAIVKLNSVLSALN